MELFEQKITMPDEVVKILSQVLAEVNKRGNITCAFPTKGLNRVNISIGFNQITFSSVIEKSAAEIVKETIRKIHSPSRQALSTASRLNISHDHIREQAKKAMSKTGQPTPIQRARENTLRMKFQHKAFTPYEAGKVWGISGDSARSTLLALTGYGSLEAEKVDDVNNMPSWLFSFKQAESLPVKYAPIGSRKV